MYSRVFRTRVQWKYCIAIGVSVKIRTCTNGAYETHQYITLLMSVGSNVPVLQHFRYPRLKNQKEYYQYLHTFHVIDGQCSQLFQIPSVCRLPKLRTYKHSTSSRNSRSQFIFDLNGIFIRSSGLLLSNIYIGQSVRCINHIPLRRTSHRWYRRTASIKLKILPPIQVIINISTPRFCTRPCRPYRSYILISPKASTKQRCLSATSTGILWIILFTITWNGQIKAFTTSLGGHYPRS